MAKTQVWWVSYESGKVLVRDTEPAPSCNKYRIRTISPNAAGRKFIKEILPSIWTAVDMEDLSPFSYEWDRKHQKKEKEYKKLLKNLEIVVIRDAVKQEEKRKLTKALRDKQKRKGRQ